MTATTLEPNTRVDMNRVRRILIIKMSALGDIIHALPVSAALGEAFPHIALTWAVEESFAPLLQGNPYLEQVLTLPKLRTGHLRSAVYRRNYMHHLRAVRTAGFDLTIDLQGLTKSAVVAAASGARVRLGYHWLREAAGLIEKPVPRHPGSVHIVEQYLDVARFLGAKIDAVRFPFAISDADRRMVAAMLAEAGVGPNTPFISINPASAQPIKQWGAERYAALMDAIRERLGVPAALVTADKAVAEEVAIHTRQPFVNLAGRTNLKQLGAVLARSQVHVCGDTGSAHLAAALGIPVVALVGPTDPDRTCPYGQRRNVLSHREVCGTACTWHKCEFPHPRCLDAITVEETLARVEANLPPGARSQNATR